MKNQAIFDDKLNSLQVTVRRYQGALLAWENFQNSLDNRDIRRRYSEETLTETQKNLLDEIVFCGNEVADLTMWIRGACISTIDPFRSPQSEESNA